MHKANKSDGATLRCSFCGISQHRAGKLVSSPANLPRACICAECIATCMLIFEVDQEETEPEAPDSSLSHPLATELIAAVADWFTKESRGEDADSALSHVAEYRCTDGV